MVGESLDKLLLASPSLAETLRGIDLAAATQTPVLILGESGTGRSALARAIHRHSPRSVGPLVEVDPGVVPASLFESDLFGYRSGAFTGAESDSPGRVELARLGTLVLDHVEALPITIQPKLLRLLAEQRYAPLGGRDRRADVRFVAIATPDLRRRVDSGAFRADLFFRLEVLAFHLPPLRRRLADLPTLVQSLLEDLAHRFGRSIPKLTESSWDWMSDYSWPGNLRQVRNLLERQMILSTGDELELPPPADAVELQPCSLMDLEREHILRTLAYTRGHQGRAAEILGISRKALWEKRKRFDIP